MAIEWMDSYRLGHPDIDAQHQMLFNMVNRLLAATEKAGLTEAIANLFEYTQEHFTREETIMRAIAYPHTEAHVAQHTTLLSKLDNVAELIANYTFDVTSFRTFFSAWVLAHMETQDAQLVTYIGQQES